MKKKIPFDISYRPQIESGEVEVVTGDDRPVRIVYWDKKDEYYPIVALVQSFTEDEEQEDVEIYTTDGHYSCERKHKDDDLFLLVEVGLTEFEQAIAEMVDKAQKNVVEPLVVAEQWKDVLLDIAKKELRPEIDKELQLVYKNQDEVVYQRGYDAGFEAGSEIDEEKLTDKIAEKVAEKIVLPSAPSPTPNPWTPNTPITPITVMYGCNPVDFRPTAADAGNWVTISTTADSITEKEEE